MPIFADSHQTILDREDTGTLGTIRLDHPAGTFAPTPASMISLQAVVTNAHRLRGRGVDWGCGCGILSIAASRVEQVQGVLALDISGLNIEATRANVETNRAEKKVQALVADSFRCLEAGDQTVLDSLRGQLDFVLANPPSSEGDDGFTFRRIVLRDSTEYLKAGGVIFLSISAQYGERRILGLVDEVPGYVYGGLLATTDFVPFDLRRPDLLHALELYAAEEDRNGIGYVFVDPRSEGSTLSASQALRGFRKEGVVPLSRWQTHLYRRAN